MPLISPIGRRSWRVRALDGAICLVLGLGALAMVYPFLVMVSGSTKSGVDRKRFDAVPRFLFDDLTLYRKHVEGLFNERLDIMRTAYDSDEPSFEKVLPPPDPNPALVAEWEAFLREPGLPQHATGLGYVETPVSRTLPGMLRGFKRELARRFRGDIGRLNEAMGTEFVNWSAFFMYPENYLSRQYAPEPTPFLEAFIAYKQRQPLSQRYVFNAEGYFKNLFLKTQYTRDIAEYNRAHGTDRLSYDEVRLARRMPGGNAAERRDWENFVRLTLNLLWVRVDEEARPVYQAFLEAKYGSVEALNRNYGADYASFADVPLVEELPAGGLVRSDWEAFVAGWKDPDRGAVYAPAAEHLRVESPEFLFRDRLRADYGDAGAMNRALGTAFADFDEVRPPQREAHYLAFRPLRAALRWEFATRNYRAVSDYMVRHGRGVFNTAVYCALAVLAALIVNPLAAYAMSRYRMPAAYKILLFLLLTMAFPPMVTQIPAFLMLRDFRLLNTFAALVLPGLAHGYSIFLLKGFFDSLPRELYECAQIDGAGEWTIFWNVTMSLSKPILAVIALQAFNLAYSNFMFALLICQDEKMWTLMVWLYQLQQRSGQPVMYAGLLIAAVPTFVIFLFCQNVILRGIVIPTEK